jgi:uncharacterized repeat protein (TIGR01451 family)
VTSGSSSNDIQANAISSNGGAGVAVTSGSSSNDIQANAISSNGGAGVAVTSGSSSNDIHANAMSSNGALGIDLGADGVTPNDPGDADTGPNTLQNFPTDLDFTYCLPGEACASSISGTVSSAPITEYRVDLYDNAACDASGFGEGGTFLGSATTTTNAAGVGTFTFPSPTALASTSVITATASVVVSVVEKADGAVLAAAADIPATDTSEFSECRSKSANLVATKTVSRSQATIGDSLTYTVTVENLGPDAARGVAVSDLLPAGAQATSASSAPGTCTVAATVSCAVGTLPAGATAGITITASVSAAGTLTNTATASSGTPDPDLGNNRASATTEATSADLSVTKTAAPDPVNVGDTLTYTLTVRNAGPSAAADVRLTDALDATTTFVSATPTQGTCAGAPTLVCLLGPLAAGAQATVEVRVVPRTAGTLTNVAAASSATGDPNPANNSGSSTRTEVASADLSVTKTDAPDPITVGGSLVYKISVANAGPSTARSVRLDDVIAAGAAPVSAATSKGTCSSGRTVTCDLGAIAAGSRVTIQIRVKPRSAGKLTNTAKATSTTFDPIAGNNSATATTRVTSADLTVTVVPSRRSLKVGERVAFTVRVENRGPTAAAGVVLTLTVPKGATIRDKRCAGTRTVRCKLRGLGADAAGHVTITTRPKRAGAVTTTAKVAGADFDPDGGNNDARASATARFVPRLFLSPPIGPPGFVTLALGEGFPPSTVVALSWSTGLGGATARTSPRGRLRMPVLVFPGDLLGPRRLVATGKSSDPGLKYKPVAARFLVVPGRFQPSGFVERR